MSYFAREFRYIVVRQQLFFHDKRLIQYDCGKLQKLAHLLRALRNGGHKVLIFTQMTKMLDVLESFLNLYGYSYCRLDGSTKPEQRQLLVQRFNTDAKLFVFILSTRSGGFGINLTGADTVIFYDTDWNPAIDSQAQDRCHRIGQKREVSIYRLISEGTVEENIMKKAMRKRELDRVAIQSAMFDSFHGKKGMRFFNPCVSLNLFLFSGDVRVRENISLSDVQPELKENEVLLNVSITLLE
jgi:SNF2 family DNA or RNA helicase